MKVARNITLMCLLILCLPVTSGCGKKQEAVVKIDESKPISEVKAEAQKMDTEQLRATSLKYKETIEAKTAEVEKLAKELMKTMVAGSSGDKTKELNAQMNKMNESLKAFTERFEVYREKLKEKGGDLSGLEQ